MFEYNVTFLVFSCSNNAYSNCTWLPYTLMAIKMQIFNEFNVARLLVSWPYIYICLWWLVCIIM